MTRFFLSKRENFKAVDLHIWMGIVRIPILLNNPLATFEEAFANYPYIHSSSKPLVLCSVTGMLERIPASGAVGWETPWTEGQGTFVL